MTLKPILGCMLVITIAFSSCDKVTNPIKSKQTNSSLPNTPPDYIDSSSTAGSNSYTNYKVLIEDYMGQLCPNCPPAVVAGDALITPSNPLSGQIVLIEVNNGGFALIDTIPGVPDSAFSQDYTSVAGNNWISTFSIGQWPWGMINRMGYPNNFDIGFANWATTVQSLVTKNQQPTVTINIHDSCWVQQRIIGVEFQVSFKKALPADTDYLLEALIVQDSIVGWQKDGDSASGYSIYFVHRNVLRGAFDLQGIGTKITPTTVGTTFTSYQTYDFNKGENGRAGGTRNNHPWNMAKCNIVAIVRNAISQRVVQAEMIKIE